MSGYEYDPDSPIVSTVRSLKAHVEALVAADTQLAGVTEVEMSFPDTTVWTKDQPLGKTIIHFDIDDQENPVIGFGRVGKSTFVPGDPEGTVGHELFQEATRHMINFDVGIWASAQSGGHTKRLEVREMLTKAFASAGGRKAFNEATGGLQVARFEGGEDVIDRINDLPLWRTAAMTLVLDVFGRITPEIPDTVPLSIGQDPHLTIVTNDGEQHPV